jgi:hypothetical protein
MAGERPSRSAKLEATVDTLAADVKDLSAEVKQVRVDLGAEIKQVRVDLEDLRTEVKTLRTDLESMEHRLSQKISTEIAHALGVIEERFVNLFGLLDDKYGGATSELRRDLDEHRFDRSIHLPRE